ncbi:hypothetical protein R6Q59_023204 [Mikania micrantha]
MAITEFLLFVLTATIGGMFLCGANDLITIFVAPECFSLCSYLLSGYTKKDVRSNEATMKYLLMGGASSSILVHGFSWLYGSSGGEIELQEIVNGPSSHWPTLTPVILRSYLVFRVCLDLVPLSRPAPKQCFTPRCPVNCCASTHFGENQLALGSSGISPLTTTHPLILQHQSVRTST